jgi:phosphoribosylformylglycinamidine synthase
MVTRIEIATREPFKDARGDETARRISEFLGVPVARVRTRDVYKIEGALEPADAEAVCREFTDPVTQVGALGRVPGGDFDVAVAVGLRPGVTDSVGKSARIAVEDTIGRPLGSGAAVYTSRLYLLSGVTEVEAWAIAEGLLANPLVETIEVASRAAFEAAPPDLEVPRIEAAPRPAVAGVDLSGSDEDLRRISREGLLSLSLEEMKAIRDHFRAAATHPGREGAGLGGSPTDAELECLAQTWSEHCKHKIFNADIEYVGPDGEEDTIHSLFATYVRGATEAVDRHRKEAGLPDLLVSVFHDNAGVIAFEDDLHLVYKVETHNSPSALDPYGGAMTGIVGVNRDPFGTGLGADLLVNVWGYCFGDPRHDEPLPEGLLHPRRIRDGVHQGVIDGGNQSGIPYGRGWELFDARYLGKPLVYCGTVGSLPATVTGRPSHVKTPRPGDRVVMVGGRIGKDGIHGATFSSAALDDASPVQAVQIGDPITQKRMFELLLEARERGLYSAITDNGAGGLSSSVGEMAQLTGGALLDLSSAPLKYQGLAPWEVLVSEAQERMTLAVPADRLDAFLDLARRREVEATDLGEFTASGVFHVTWGEETVAYLPMDFLHDGLPAMRLRARWSPPAHEDMPVPEEPHHGELLLEMMARPNLASNEEAARHYDHEVKGLSVVKPFVGARADLPADGTVFLARHGPSRAGFVLAEGINPFLSDLDARAMAIAAVDLAVRRTVGAGARLDHMAALDNFCWPDPVVSEGNPDGEHKLAQLVRACQGLHDACVAYGVPLISGKDSMKNDAVLGGVKISIPPTLLVSAIGKIDDVTRAVTPEAKVAGDAVYLIGESSNDTGGSEYLRMRGYVGRQAPEIDFERALYYYRAVQRASSAGMLRSCHALHLGGLAAGLARVAMGGELGLSLNLDHCPELTRLRDDVALFAESLGRFVVTVPEVDAASLEEMFGVLACRRIGAVTEEPRLVIRLGGRDIVDVPVGELKRRWQSTLRFEER